METFPMLSLFLLLLASTCSGQYKIGVNYGTLGNNLPPPAKVAEFLKTQTNIDRVKIFDTNNEILKAFAKTGIAVTVTIGNGDIPELANLPSAKTWVAQHIAPYHPETKIIRIAMGNEILKTGDKNLIAKLLPAMKTVHKALTEAGIKDVQVSTPHTLGIIKAGDEPSTGRFRAGYDKLVAIPMLQFLRETKSVWMINPYPYFGYGGQALDYAVFRPNAGIHDKATGKTYTNMFDAQLDAMCSAMKAAGYGDVEIVVAETGWPSLGDPNQPDANMQNALSYNGELVKHVNSGKGTPLMPNKKFETYIFALFNENQKPWSLAERNFGLFYPDMKPVYEVGIMKKPTGGNSPGAAPVTPTPKLGPATPTPKPGPAAPVSPTPKSGPAAPVTPMPSAGKKYCVPKSTVSDVQLQRNIDYICGTNKVDCKQIQAPNACYLPNTIKKHANWVMNEYYHKMGANDHNCDFNGTGEISAADSSYKRCKYSS